MNKKLGAVALAATLFFVAACSSTLKVGEVNSAGRFDSNSTVDAEDIQVNAAYTAEEFGTTLVVQSFTENNTVNEFYYESLKNSQRFERVWNEEDVERFVLQNGIDGVTDASSILSLSRLREEIGPFLIVKPYFEWSGGYNYSATIEAIDPEDGNVVFQAEKRAFNWGGLDKPLFYPLFNSFMDWVDGTPVTATAGEAEEAAEADSAE